MTALFSGPPDIPPPPPPAAIPPPAPQPVDASVQKAGADFKKRAAAASGISSTIATGPQGLVPAPETTRGQLKPLLGN